MTKLTERLSVNVPRAASQLRPFLYGAYGIGGNPIKALGKIIHFSEVDGLAGVYAPTNDGFKDAVTAAQATGNFDTVLLPARQIELTESYLISGIRIAGLLRTGSILYANGDYFQAVDPYASLIKIIGGGIIENLTVRYVVDADRGGEEYASVDVGDLGVSAQARDVTAIIETSNNVENMFAINGVAYSTGKGDFRPALENCVGIAIGANTGARTEVRRGISFYLEDANEEATIKNCIGFADAGGGAGGSARGMALSGSPDNQSFIQDCVGIGISSEGAGGGIEFDGGVVKSSLGYTECKNGTSTGIWCNDEGEVHHSTGIVRVVTTGGTGFATGLFGQDLSKFYHSTGIVLRDVGSLSSYGLYLSGATTADHEASHCRFVGPTSDVFISSSAVNFTIYSCRYSSLDNTAGGTIVYDQGDRGTYEVEEFHGSDIGAAALTRHAPLPGTAGNLIEDDGSNWQSVTKASMGIVDHPITFEASSILTIGTGAVTVTKDYHIIAAESGTADDLDTINGGSTGQTLLIQADAGDTITVKHGTGNIELNGSADHALSGNLALLLVYEGGVWVDVGITGTGGSGAPTGASYVVMSLDATLTAERVLTGTADQVIVTDGGGGGNVTLSTPQDIASTSSPTFAGLTITGNVTPTLAISDSASDPPLNITERSTAPSAPATNDIYLDDGTNTASGNPGWRRYTGTVWEDIGATTGGGGAPTNASYVVMSLDATLTDERVLTGTANQITVTDGGAGGNVTLSTPQDLHTAAVVQFGTLTLDNTGLHLLDTDASHDLIIKPGSNLTLDRTLTVTTGDADRTITLSGNPTLSDWFDQDVQIAASPTFAGLTITGSITPTLAISDSASDPPLNVTERSTAPSAPATNDIYLDDGTNTASGNPGWRRYTGTVWEDVGATVGSFAPTNATYVVISLDATLTDERVLAGTANQVIVTDGGAGGNVTLSTPQDLHTAAVVQFGTLTLDNAGLHLLDTDASHDLIIKPGSNLTLDRTLTVTTGDADRVVTLSGDPTLSDWFDQGVKTTSSPTFAGLTITGSITPTLAISDSASDPPLNITERSTAPSSPATNDIYLDDGSNTASGNPGWRRYTGTVWEDIGATTGGGGAPTNATYVVMSLDATLTDERVLTGTANQITVTDGGAGGNATLSTPQDIATTSSPTFANVYVPSGGVVGISAAERIVFDGATGEVQITGAGLWVDSLIRLDTSVGDKIQFEDDTVKSKISLAATNLSLNYYAGHADGASGVDGEHRFFVDNASGGWTQILTITEQGVTVAEAFTADTVALLETSGAGPDEVILRATSTITADRFLDFATGDANRVITLQGDPTLSDWFDQGVKTTSSPTFADITADTVALLETSGAGPDKLTIRAGSTLTTNRLLDINTGDADRVITLQGNPTLDDWFDQSVKQAASPQFDSLTLDAAGTLTVGVSDPVTLSRGAANRWDIGTDDDMRWVNTAGEYIEIRTAGTTVWLFAEESAGTDLILGSRVSGDTNNRFQINANGAFQWGPGNAAVDTDLYRASANVLRTTDTLRVDSDLYTDSFQSWSPTITGFTGTSSTTYYKKVGNLLFVFFSISGTASGTSVTFTLPYTSASVGANLFVNMIRIQDAGSWAAGMAIVSNNSTTVTCYPDAAGSAWTNSGNRSVRGQFVLEVQ